MRLFLLGPSCNRNFVSETEDCPKCERRNECLGEKQEQDVRFSPERVIQFWKLQTYLKTVNKKLKQQYDLNFLEESIQKLERFKNVLSEERYCSYKSKMIRLKVNEDSLGEAICFFGKELDELEAKVQEFCKLR